MKIKTVNGTFDSNTFVVSDRKKALIIDSGASLADVVAAVGKDQVVAVLVTHEHFDHLTNCVAYAQHFQVPIYGTREVLDNLKYYRDALPSEVEPGVLYPIVVYDPAVTFVTIADEQPLTVAHFTIQPYICQGHSAGSLVFQIGDNLFTGDVLFNRGIGNQYMTNGKTHLIQSLQRLQTLTFVTAYHGHGDSSDFTAQQRNLQVWLKWLTR